MNKLYLIIKSMISRVALSILLLMTSLVQSNATHIVGGTITYKCLGGEKYEISVTMRRDCFNGDPEAFFDDPASIGIFDQNGVIIRAVGTNGQLILPLKFNDTLDEIREDICAVNGTTSVCIHETTYKGIITLPFRPGGYIIEYQRCCRNGIIQNIQDPLQTGASWVVHINEDAMKSCNSSPRFKQWSPIFLCAGQPYRFDHGAVDDNGDSLVYKLWTPFLGATRSFPKPQPPNTPDLKKISWKSPYSETDMLGGDPFRIDSKTGELFAIPANLGQYLLGVQVEEYRHGLLLSTVYRDFEVTILDCSNLVDAKIVAPKLQCDNLTINFKQESLNPKYVKWFFDFGRNPNATSTETSPTYKYTDTGTYKIALVITRDSSCFDTAFQTIRLKLSKTTVPLFAMKAGDCVNGSLKISMIDLSTGVEPGSKYTWTVQFNNQTITSNEKAPTFTVPNGVLATIKLEISQDGEGCSVNISKTFITSFIQPEFHKDQAVACIGDSVAIKFILQDSIKGKYNYIWDANPLIVGGKNTPEPIVFSSIAQSGYIYVTVDNKQGCTSRDSILIIFKAKPKMSYTFANVCGSLSIKVKNTSDTLRDYMWNFGDGGISTEREPAHTYLKAGKYTVTLSTTIGCAPSLSKTFNIGDIICFDLTDSIVGCIGSTLMINPKANPAYAYQWRPTNKLNDLTIPNPSFKVDSARTFIADISDVNTGIGLGKITIKVLTPGAELIKAYADTVQVCTGDTAIIKFLLSEVINAKYKFTWDANPIIVTGSNSAEPKVLSPVDQSKYIFVNIDDNKGCVTRDSILIVSKAKPKLAYTFINACGSLKITVKNQSDSLASYLWDFGDGSNSIEREPVHTYTKPGKYTVTLSTKVGCAPSLSKTFNIGDIICFDLTDSIISCIGATVLINPKANPVYAYQWRPTNKLSDLTIPNPSFKVDSARTFIADISDVNTGIGLGKITIKVLTPAAELIKAYADTLKICTGDTANVKFLLSDATKAKYKFTWDFSPFIVAGGNSAEPRILSQVVQSLYIFVTIDDNKGCLTRDSILIVAKAKPKLAFTFINACGSLKITIKNQSDSLTSYIWDFGDGSTSVEKEPFHTYAKSGKYTVTLTTKDGCAPSLSKTFNIGDFNCLNLSDTINACVGRSININRNVNAAYFYIWRPTNKLSDLNSPNPVFIVDSARTFIADFFDVNTGIGLGSLTVVVRTPLVDQVKNIPDTIIACAGQAVALNPKANTALKYEWTPVEGLDNPNSPNPTVTVTKNSVFNVKITNPTDSCTLTDKVVVVLPAKTAIDAIPDSLDACIGVTINLNPNGKADPNLKYKWAPGNVLDDSTKFNPTATITKPIIFTVLVTDIRFPNCFAGKTIKVNIPIINEAAKIKDSITVCPGIPVALNPTGDPRFKFEWTPATGLDNVNLANPTATVSQTTTYTVKITDIQRGNCTQTKQIKVKVPPAFTVTPAYRDTISCTATSFRLRVSSNNPKVTFEWFTPNGTKISGSDTVTVSPVQKTIYKVTGTDENGCKRTDSVSVDPAKINIDAQAGAGLLCAGDSMKLQVVGSNPGQELTYQWTPANLIISGANTANPTVKPIVKTTFIVRVSNKQGCSATDSVEINVSQYGTITVSVNPTTIITGQTAQITSTNLAGYTYRWLPIDGLDNPAIPNPKASPKRTTTYTLTATNPEGCARTFSVTITVTIPECAEPFIFLPNAFSPNGDGKNDVLYLRSNIVDRMSLIIYDRWGEKVFETTNQSVGWDGTYKGKLLPPDAYGFYLTAVCIDGKSFNKKGNVTILK